MPETAMFDASEIAINCPECKHANTKTIGWIRTHGEVTCAGCGKTITLKTEGLKDGLRSVDKSLADFKRDISRTMKLTLKL